LDVGVVILTHLIVRPEQAQELSLMGCKIHGSIPERDAETTQLLRNSVSAHTGHRLGHELIDHYLGTSL
jgi:hypothetical protein